MKTKNVYDNGGTPWLLYFISYILSIISGIGMVISFVEHNLFAAGFLVTILMISFLGTMYFIIFYEWSTN